MKKFIGLVLLIFLSSCAVTQKPQEITVFKSPEAKIQYYQEQINRYNYLIEQEKKKIELSKLK